MCDQSRIFPCIFYVWPVSFMFFNNYVTFVLQQKLGKMNLHKISLFTQDKYVSLAQGPNYHFLK